MNRTVLLAALLSLPLLASAQAIRCTDPATGKTLYTDQPCQGGQLVVPPRTAEEQRRDAESAAAAREQALRREELTLQREQQRLDAARVQEAARPPASPADSEACRAARAEAAFRAGSFSASEEEIRTARHNAALACGQQPPADIVVVQPYAPVAPYPRPPHRYPRPGHGEYSPGWGGGFGMPRPQPPRPRYEPGTEPIPAQVRPPSAR